jgi:hypothetical protein
MNGTKLPDEIKELSKNKIVTLCLLMVTGEES